MILIAANDNSTMKPLWVIMKMSFPWLGNRKAVTNDRS